jgi:hypothetical protein
LRGRRLPVLALLIEDRAEILGRPTDLGDLVELGTYPTVCNTFPLALSAGKGDRG